MSGSCRPRGVGKRRSRSGGKNTAEEAELVVIGKEFLSLQLRLGRLFETQRSLWPGSAWTEESERKWALKVDPIRERMAELRTIAIQSAAETLAELKAKAVILMDLVENDPSDAYAQLTLSLCLDLLAYSAELEFGKSAVDKKEPALAG